MSETILKIEHLAKSYGKDEHKIEVLRDVNLNVRKGEIVVIMGPSGVGKSTLLHLVGGLDKPTNGNITISGTDLFSLSDNDLARFRNRNIGFVFQFHHLLTEFTALENVMIPGMIHESNGKLQEKATQLLSEVGLSERLQHKPGELSGGEQQRVAVARALINRPQLVLADEPTGNLDKRNSEAMYRLILDLNNKFEQTFIIVTHNELMAEQATTVVELEDGVIVRHTRR